MQKQSLALLAGALILVAAGALVVPQWFAEADVPLVRWDAKDELEVADPDGDAENAAALAAGAERTAVEPTDPGARPAEDARVDVILRGRIVSKWKAPVADATVYLDFGRGGPRGGGPGGGRQRRVPDPVQSDRDGRFAFQGQAFRNLRISLQVGHRDYAPSLFDRDLGQVAAEVDLGDLMVTNGGELVGRVTDLEGNGILGAKVELGPENANQMRGLRNRDKLLPTITTDNNGFFRQKHVPAGDWSVTATAKMHTEGRSPTFVAEEDQLVEIEDIRLGPGFEVTGYVRNTQGQPIAKADVSLRSQQPNRGRGGRGGPGGGPGGGAEDWRAMFSRDHTTTTDEQGRFFLEHLPAVAMRLETRAEGYLDFQQEGLDPKLGQPIHVTMQDGLRIAGTVVDAVDSQAVTVFAVRATRVRGLPVPGQTDLDLQALVTQMRDGSLDEATRQQARTQMESLRSTMGGDFRRGGPGGRGNDNGNDSGNDPRSAGGRGAARDLGKPEKHPGGTFVVTGLQEGIYEVHVQSPDHARFRSKEVEVRFGLQAPAVAASLDRGLYVAGVVTSDKGDPIKGARVELRAASAIDAMGRGRRGRGGNNADPTAGIDLAAVGREWLQMANGTQVTLEATTDAEGTFVIKHALPGTYRLQGQARGFANANSENFDLQADRSGLALQLGALGAVAGTVRGLRANDHTEARVAAVMVGGGGGGGMRGRGGPGGGQDGGGGGPFNSVTVQPDGSYRIDNLAPGDYLVRSWIGSAQEIMRELGPQFAAGTLTPDVKVKGGETSKFDVAVTLPQVGEVAGTVMHNGAAATGFRVELTRVDDTGAAQPERGGRGGGPGGGGRNGMFGGGRSQQATVANSGRFTIKDVPAGNYQLRVQAARRGGLLHEEQIQVVADAVTERNVQVSTGALQGTVSAEAGVKASDLGGSVSLLPGLTALPENYQAWRREAGNTGFDARVQNGAFAFEALKPGNYLLVLSIRGRERTTMPVFVAAGNAQPVAAVAGKVAAAAPPGVQGPGQTPNGNPVQRTRGNAGAAPGQPQAPNAPTRR